MEAKAKAEAKTVQKKEPTKQPNDQRFQSAINPNRRSVDLSSPLTSL